MILQDTPQNTKIVYLYVNEFDYGQDHIGREQTLNHPKSKKVYRAIYNTETKTYRAVYKVDKDVHSVFIGGLQVREEDSGFICDIHILIAENILDFNISESNLDELLNWLKTDNNDIKAILGDIGGKPLKKRQLPVNTSVSVPPQVNNGQQQGMKLPPELVQLIKLGSELQKTDPILFGTIFDLIVFLTNDSYTETGILGTSWLKMDKDHGAGVNVSAAVEKMSRYLGQDRRNNLDNNDLMGAIKDLLIEKSRRNYHEIE